MTISLQSVGVRPGFPRFGNKVPYKALIVDLVDAIIPCWPAVSRSIPVLSVPGDFVYGDAGP